MLRPLKLDKNPAYQQTGFVALAQASPKAVNAGKAAAAYLYEGPKDIADPLIRIDPFAQPKPKTDDWHHYWPVVILIVVFLVVALLFLAVVVATKSKD